MIHENRPRRSKQRISRDYSHVVLKTIEAYCEAKERLLNAPIAAINLDDEAKPQTNIYTTAE